MNSYFERDTKSHICNEQSFGTDTIGHIGTHTKGYFPVRRKVTCDRYFGTDTKDQLGQTKYHIGTDTNGNFGIDIKSPLGKNKDVGP